MKDDEPEGLDSRLRAHWVAMAEEQQEACIHCKAVWYSIHYRDGVCHTCRLEGKPGRTELENWNFEFSLRKALVGLVIITLILRALLG